MTRTRKTYRDFIANSDLELIAEEVDKDIRSGAKEAMTRVVFDTESYRESLIAAVDEAFSLDIYDLLLRGWSGWRDVQKLLAEDGPVDGRTRRVQIVAHALTARHEPELEMRFRVVGAPPLLVSSKIAIETSFAVGAVAVAICDRQIVEVTGVEATPSIKVKIRGQTVSTMALDPIRFAPLYDPVGTPAEPA